MYLMASSMTCTCLCVCYRLAGRSREKERDDGLPWRRVFAPRRTGPCSWVWDILLWSSVCDCASCAPGGKPKSSTPSHRCCCWHRDSTCASTSAIVGAGGLWRLLSATLSSRHPTTRRKMTWYELFSVVALADEAKGEKLYGASDWNGGSEPTDGNRFPAMPT